MPIDKLKTYLYLDSGMNKQEIAKRLKKPYAWVLARDAEPVSKRSKQIITKLGRVMNGRLAKVNTADLTSAADEILKRPAPEGEARWKAKDFKPALEALTGKPVRPQLASLKLKEALIKAKSKG